MANLPKGEKERRKEKMAGVLRYFALGLSEEEIAEETGLHRRTVNNYLRELKREGKAHKKGRRWFPF